MEGYSLSVYLVEKNNFQNSAPDSDLEKQALDADPNPDPKNPQQLRCYITVNL